ncbi:MAG: methyltransferase domain-containing protein, partial [Actinomycetales bacterium]|nr:methyltransferase domain-containing protein [Actinomycetales bacterium]
SANAAEKLGVEMLVGDHLTTCDSLSGRQFDCLMYADVLEHIREPESVLAAHIPLLKPGGTVIISVPNFRHYTVFCALFLHGEPPYTDAGLFDRTHVRLTTRKLIAKWITDAGLTIEHVELRPWRRREAIISRLLWGGLREFFSYQIITVARKPDHESEA